MMNMGVYLYSPDKQISNQLLDQGLLPHQGLEINSQGPLQPLIPTVKNDKKDMMFLGGVIDRPAIHADPIK